MSNAGLVQIVYVRCVGGEMGAVHMLAPKVGPLGLSPKRVAEDIAVATSEWRGLRITVKLTVKDRVARIDVVPSASSYLFREMGVPPQSQISHHSKRSSHHAEPSGALSMDAIVKIARLMRTRSVARTLTGTVLEILGTAQSIRAVIDGQHPAKIVEGIRSGDIKIPEE